MLRVFTGISHKQTNKHTKTHTRARACASCQATVCSAAHSHARARALGALLLPAATMCTPQLRPTVLCNEEVCLIPEDTVANQHHADRPGPFPLMNPRVKAGAPQKNVFWLGSDSIWRSDQNRTESVDVTPTAELLAAMRAPPAKQQPLPQ